MSFESIFGDGQELRCGRESGGNYFTSLLISEKGMKSERRKVKLVPFFLSLS